MKTIKLASLTRILFLITSTSALTGSVYAQSLGRLREKIVMPTKTDTTIVPVDSAVQVGRINRSEVFSQFSAGLGAVFNGSSKGTSFDLSSLTLRYFIPLGVKNESVTVVDDNGHTIPGAVRSRFRGLDVHLINRAALNTDSLKALANDYITSLQSSPLTFRLSYDGYLTKNQIIDVHHVLPVIKYRFSTDIRAVPYGNKSNTVDFGASYSLFFSILAQLRGIQDEEGVIEDEGTFYFEPSVGLVGGSQSMMETIFTDRRNRALVTSELRMGFLSDKNKIRDFGVIVRYTLADVSGAKFKIGFNIAPNFQ